MKLTSSCPDFSFITEAFRNHIKCLELLSELLENVYHESSQELFHGRKPGKHKSAVSWHFLRAVLQLRLNEFPFGPVKQTTHIKDLIFCCIPSSILSVVPQVCNTEAQITYKSGMTLILLKCQCTNCVMTCDMY